MVKGIAPRVLGQIQGTVGARHQFVGTHVFAFAEGNADTRGHLNVALPIWKSLHIAKTIVRARRCACDATFWQDEE